MHSDTGKRAEQSGEAETHRSRRNSKLAAAAAENFGEAMGRPGGAIGGGERGEMPRMAVALRGRNRQGD